jgi:hypothetical protein
VRQGVRVLPGARRAQDEHKPQLPAAASGGYEASSDGSVHATKEEKVRTSGQALGGHKRLHYDGGGAADGVKDNKEQPIVKAKQPSPATVLTADGVKDNKEQPIVKAKQLSPATVLRDFDRKIESGLILRFMKLIIKSASLSTGTSSPTERITNRKYNIYVFHH